MDADQHSSGDRIQDRIPGSRLKLWVLLTATRWVVAATISGGLFCVFVVIGALDPVPLREALVSTDSMDTLFQALTTAIITGVTLVVTINQLVLSQELGPVGDQRERMAGAISFRQDVASKLPVETMPPEPNEFLRTLVDRTGEGSQRLTEAVEECRDRQARTAVQAYADRVQENATAVSQQLTDAEFGTFDVVSAALNFNYSLKIADARRLRIEHGESLPPEANEALGDVLETLELFGPAREHIKTLYFQWELVNLSRVLLYTALPALVVSMTMVLYVDDGAVVAWSLLGVDGIVWLASAAVVVSLAPFVLLVVYILRIATVAKRTLAIGPFVLRDG